MAGNALCCCVKFIFDFFAILYCAMTEHSAIFVNFCSSLYSSSLSNAATQLCREQIYFDTASVKMLRTRISGITSNFVTLHENYLEPLF